MDPGYYSDGITKTPIVIDNVIIFILNLFIIIGIWNYQSWFWR